ncbi:ROK family transcriptional regulator [uncultured Microbacterium sp.]|uniref:ROK family transcriptional regulator n=1 Tax=uncultured Microbacterium sp. TaxID=191216 RepID=UPI00260B627C|nr:ROK family transcriptional regulator [uncultured Microbacterium sp.]
MTRTTGPADARGGFLRVPGKSRPQDSRRANRSLLLQELFTRGALSRADLARISGLTRPTVSKVIGQLLEDGIVRELAPEDEAAPPAQQPARAGKKGIRVAIRDDELNVIALDLSSPTHALGARTDLRGRLLDTAEFPWNGATGERAIEIVQTLIMRLRSGAAQTLATGIAVPGIVSGDGYVRMGVRLGWHDVALSDRLTAATGIPTYASNDSQTIALGVHAYGAPVESARRSLMAVTIEHGVGAGFILDGMLFQGSQYAAGEFGHVTVDPDGPACLCGRRGCLDAIASAPQLRSRLEATGTERRAQELRSAGGALGLILAPIVSALDLDEVVVCGPADLVEGEFLRAAIDGIRSRNLDSVSHDVSMRYAGSGHEAALTGATALVLSKTLGIA